MPKILHLDENHELLKNELEKLGFKNYFDLISTKKEIENKIWKYQGIILRSRIEIDKRFIDSCKNLKFIARVGSGLENIDTDYAKKKNIEIISAAEGNANAVGEHALGMLLSLLNKIINYPKHLEDFANERSPHSLVHFLKELAADFHSFYETNPVLVENDTVANSRLIVTKATQIVLKNGLELLSVKPLSKM